MTPDRYERAKAIFLATRQRPSEERSACLDQECGGDAELRSDVESLLVHDLGPTVDLLETPLRSPPTAADPQAGLIGRRIGHYSIKRVIASGGMGTVYEAVQEQPRRVVALKVMRPGIASRSALHRFEYESQILARLHHPGIAQIYEAGVHREGEEQVPFFAMEYIPNAQPITRYADEKKLGTRERLELFARVCEAVHHGHQKGIIHRDLKPGNILVDSSGQPKVIDFGVARATDSDLAVTTLQTDVGQLIGTLQYMSPEQCQADPHDIDTRSDVYALGVVLYELLCDQLPYDLTKVAVYEAARVIREQPPTKPSTISRTLRGDVETIALKALEKDRDQRYRSAADLGDDLQRYLNNEPIEATAPSVVYQIRMFARRNKTVFRATVAVVAVLVLGLATTLWQAQRANDRAEAAQKAEAAQGRLAESESIARKTAEFQSYLANIAAADAALRVNALSSVRHRLDACPQHLRGWEWGYLNAESDRSLASYSTGSHADFGTVAYTPAGLRSVSFGYRSKDATVIDVESGKELAVLRGHTNSVLSASFSRDGSMIVTTSRDGTVRVWDTTTGRERLVLRGHEQPVDSADFSPDGTRVVTTARDQPGRVWSLKDGKQLASLQGAARRCAFSPDGLRVVTGSDAGTAKIWDAHTGALLSDLAQAGAWVTSAAFSSDGARVVTGSADGTATVWDVASAKMLQHLSHGSYGERIGSAIFSPDGTCVLTVGEGAVARLWRLSEDQDGNAPVLLRGDEEDVSHAAFSMDGRRIATLSSDGTVRVWDVATAAPCLRFDPFGEAAFMADGERLAFESSDGYGMGEVATGRLLWRDLVNVSSPGRLSRDGSTYFASGPALDGSFVLTYDVPTGSLMAVFPTNPGPDHAISPDGSRALSGWYDWKHDRCDTTVWDTSTGRRITRLHSNHWLDPLAFSHDGIRVLARSDMRSPSLWSASTGEELGVLRGHSDIISGAAFSPDDARVVTASWDKTARLWDATTGREIAVLRGHDGRVHTARFSPDGLRVLTIADDETARLWDATSGAQVGVLSGKVQAVSFTPDGQRVFAVNSAGRAFYVIDSRTCEVILELHPDKFTLGNNIAVSGDGTRVVAGRALFDCIPWRERSAKREATLAARADAEGIVAALVTDYADWGEVRRHLEGDAHLRHEVRRQALDYVVPAMIREARRVRAGSHGEAGERDAKTPTVTGLGKFGSEESPAAQATARLDTKRREWDEASQFVARLGKRLLIAQEIAAAVEADAGLGPGAREIAQDIARQLRDSPSDLNNRAWDVVRSTREAPEAYAAALRAMELALAATPPGAQSSPGYLMNTLGVAQYRVGRYREALATLAISDAIQSASKTVAHPADVAFIAMAHFKLGHADDARAGLAKLRELMAKPEHEKSEENQAFLREAEGLIESTEGGAN